VLLSSYCYKALFKYCYYWESKPSCNSPNTIQKKQHIFTCNTCFKNTLRSSSHEYKNDEEKEVCSLARMTDPLKLKYECHILIARHETNSNAANGRYNRTLFTLVLIIITFIYIIKEVPETRSPHSSIECSILLRLLTQRLHICERAAVKE